MTIKDQSIDPKRKVLYRNFHEIGTRFRVVYLVEISKTKNKFYIILFPNFEEPSIFVHIELCYKIGERLLFLQDNIFENFIKTIDIKFGKIVLENYHKKSVYN